MTNLTSEMNKIQQAQAYAEQKRYENDVTDRNLEGLVSDELVTQVMDQSDFMLEHLISLGHTRADLVRVAGL